MTKMAEFQTRQKVKWVLLVLAACGFWSCPDCAGPRHSLMSMCCCSVSGFISMSFADPADTCLFFSSVQSKRWAPEESKLHINVSDNTEVQLEILQTGTATGPTNSSTFIRASLDNLLSGVSGYRYSKFPLQLSNSMCPLYLNDLVIRAFAWKVGGYPCSRSG